jgi:hypothetical protein
MWVQMETRFAALVIPGLDPGIASTNGAHGDPRIKSGDDDEGALHQNMAISAAHIAYGAAPDLA